MFKACFEALCAAVFFYRSWGLTDALIFLGAVPAEAAGSELPCMLPAQMACPHINWFSRVSPPEPTHLLLSLTLPCFINQCLLLQTAVKTTCTPVAGKTRNLASCSIEVQNLMVSKMRMTSYLLQLAHWRLNCCLRK